MNAYLVLVVILLVFQLLAPLTKTQDAAALEQQYGTCARHYIPADKCSPEVYEQLRTKEETPPDPRTAAAWRSAKEYRSRLKNPDSMQIHMAYVTDRGDVCLEVGGQNGMGGITVSRIVQLANGRWLDEGGFGGAIATMNGGSVNRWDHVCVKGTFHPKLVAGTDVTERVKELLKNLR